MSYLVLVTILLMWAPIKNAESVNPYNVPEAVLQAFEFTSLNESYEISGHINPFYLRGDFNGNEQTDYAVLVKEKITGNYGIAICHGKSDVVHILGAGTPFARTHNLRFDAWEVYEKRKVFHHPEGPPPPKLKGEAILLLREEAGGGLVYWEGNQYRFYSLD